MKISCRSLLRPLTIAALVAGLAWMSWPRDATANVTIGDYVSLWYEAQNGNKSAEARWRYYIIGLMDGLQAVQAPAAAAGAKLHFCIPDDLPISPKYLEELIRRALERLSVEGKLKARGDQHMAVLVAVELKRTFPCE